jgi:DNA-binding protein HU-beta
MVKAELIKHIAVRTGLTQAAIEDVLNDLTKTITEQLAAGGSVKIVGFGEWSVKDTPARMGRNPKTGEPIEITARRRVVFKAGKGLKQSV